MDKILKASAKKPESKRENKVSQLQKTGQSISSPVDQILFLQSTIGNQAVGKLIKSGALQAKLKIGQPGDIYEQEADRMAERVMRMPEPQVSKKTDISNPARNNSIQRKCPGCNKGTKIAKEEDEKLQKKEASGSTPRVTPDLESSISAVRGGGQPLPESVRTFYEPRFGADFSEVRVHTDSHAAEIAESINARAFTAGNNIVFSKGQFAPGSKDGLGLMAHELTHTLQQGAVPAQLKNIQRQQETFEEPIFEPSEEKLEEMEGEGEPVEQVGIVEPDEGTKLWPEPDRKNPEIGLLPMNTRVFVDRKIDGGWYSVYVEGHQQEKSLPVSKGTQGYVAASRVNTDMPDPGSWFFRITKSGQGALALAGEVYKDNFKASWGKDYRYLVNVLVIVNEAKNRRYIYKKNPDDSWDQAMTMAGGKIWVPGFELVNALHGQVSSGSISYEILSTIGNFFVGVAAFIVGLLQGALESIADIFIGLYDLIKMAVEIVIKLFKGTLISDAKAFYEDISKIKISDIIEMVGAKWNAPGIWDRWKFRGYVIGYAIVEILLLIFSVGVVTAIKWAGKVGKIGKLAEYLSKLPKVQKIINAAKSLKGKAVDEMRAALKAAHALSEAHGWAASVLRIPMSMLRRLSELDIEKLKKLPQWVRERFARLSTEMKLFICGCASPCNIDVRKIEHYLQELAAKGAKGAKLTSVDDVLKALPASLNKAKISRKLRKGDSALMTAIKEAELTDADFAKLVDFLPKGGITSPAESYKYFARYLTAVVPSKHKSIKKLNEIAEAMLKAEPGRGKALKGSMFEQWIALHVPKLASRNFTRITFDLKQLLKRKISPLSRSVDKWVSGEIWEIKHHLGKVPADQAADYAELLGKIAPDGNLVKRVNYVFPTKEAAEANKHLADRYKFWIHYIDEATDEIAKLD